jgi:hypothetical protein
VPSDAAGGSVQLQQPVANRAQTLRISRGRQARNQSSKQKGQAGKTAWAILVCGPYDISLMCSIHDKSSSERQRRPDVPGSYRFTLLYTAANSPAPYAKTCNKHFGLYLPFPPSVHFVFNGFYSVLVRLSYLHRKTGGTPHPNAI